MYAPIEHASVPKAEFIAIASFSVPPVSHRLDSKEWSQHGTHPLNRDGHPGLGCCVGQNPFYGCAYVVQSLIGPWLFQRLQRRLSGGYRERVTTQGTRLINWAQWRHTLHNVAAPTVCPHWQSSAYDLAETSQVRLEPKECLRSSKGDTEPGHHFIRNK